MRSKAVDRPKAIAKARIVVRGDGCRMREGGAVCVCVYLVTHNEEEPCNECVMNIVTRGKWEI